MHVQSSGTPCDASMGLWGHTQCSIAADTVASTTVVARYWNHADDDADEGNQARGSLIALPAISAARLANGCIQGNVRAPALAKWSCGKGRYPPCGSLCAHGLRH